MKYHYEVALTKFYSRWYILEIVVIFLKMPHTNLLLKELWNYVMCINKWLPWNMICVPFFGNRTLPYVSKLVPDYCKRKFPIRYSNFPYDPIESSQWQHFNNIDLQFFFLESALKLQRQSHPYIFYSMGWNLLITSD